MNQDKGSYQLSHVYDRVLDVTADRCIKTGKNGVGWLEFNVPFQHKYGYIRDDGRTEYQLFLMRSKRQNQEQMFGCDL